MVKVYSITEVNEDDRKACFALTGDLVVPVVTTDDKKFTIGFDKSKIDALLHL